MVKSNWGVVKPAIVHKMHVKELFESLLRNAKG